MYPAAFRITEPLAAADPVAAGRTRWTSTTCAAFIFSYTNRPAPSSTKRSTPPMIQRVAHFDASGFRLVRSIRKSLSSAAMFIRAMP